MADSAGIIAGPPDFQIVERRAFFRPRGAANAYELADLISNALPGDSRIAGTQDV